MNSIIFNYNINIIILIYILSNSLSNSVKNEKYCTIIQYYIKIIESNEN